MLRNLIFIADDKQRVSPMLPVGVMRSVNAASVRLICFFCIYRGSFDIGAGIMFCRKLLQLCLRTCTVIRPVRNVGKRHAVRFKHFFCPDTGRGSQHKCFPCQVHIISHLCLMMYVIVRIRFVYCTGTFHTVKNADAYFMFGNVLQARVKFQSVFVCVKQFVVAFPVGSVRLCRIIENDVVGKLLMLRFPVQRSAAGQKVFPSLFQLYGTPVKL